MRFLLEIETEVKYLDKNYLSMFHMNYGDGVFSGATCDASFTKNCSQMYR
jgi:hypothetical protein